MTTAAKVQWTKIGEVQGSGNAPYVISRSPTGELGCSCPAWRFSGNRGCKHTAKFSHHDAPVPAPQVKAPVAGAALTAGQKAAATRKARLAIAPALPVLPPPSTVESVLKVMLAEMWDRVQNLAGWMASEKYDGVRGYWTGSRFLTRKSHEVHAPDWYIASMPQGVALDGEFWLGHNRLPETSGIVNSALHRAIPRFGGTQWQKMHFVVFDAPDHGGPFAQRVAALPAMVGPSEAFRNGRLFLVQQVTVPDNATLLRLLAAVEAKGGEGLVAKDPRSMYEDRRSSAELKVITKIRFESVVTGYKPGERGFAGTMGACYAVRLDDGGQRVGPEFKVGGGFDHRQRRAPPPVGCVITVEAKGFMVDSNKPREPIFICARDYE